MAVKVPRSVMSHYFQKILQGDHLNLSCSIASVPFVGALVVTAGVILVLLYQLVFSRCKTELEISPRYPRQPPRQSLAYQPPHHTVVPWIQGRS